MVQKENNKYNSIPKLNQVLSKTTIKDDIGVYCKPNKLYEIVGYDILEGLITIEGEDQQWLQITNNDPDFVFVYGNGDA